MSNPNINIQLIDYINENFNGDTKINALNFVHHLISHGMTVSLGEATDGDGMNDCRFFYNGKKVCDMYFGSSTHNPGYPEPYTIWTTSDTDFSKPIENVPFNDRMKEIAWANVHACDPSCKNTETWCKGSKVFEIFGRVFKNLCVPIYFTCDPDAETIECAKKLIEMRKFQIDNT